MKKAVLITGIPGTGKSTLTRQFLNDYADHVSGEFEFFKEGLVIGHKLGSVVVFGDYTDPTEIFPGTDRMSMAVSPEFQEYVKKNSPKIFLEGDRLVGNKTIDFILDEGYDLQVIALKVSLEKVQARYVERGSNQDPQFLKSKGTKVSNITSRMDLNMDGLLTEELHEVPSDTNRIVSNIIKFLEG